MFQHAISFQNKSGFCRAVWLGGGTTLFFAVASLPPAELKQQSIWTSPLKIPLKQSSIYIPLKLFSWEWVFKMLPHYD